MRLIMIDVLIMNFGGFLFNPHYLHTLLHDAHSVCNSVMSVCIH